MCQEIWKDVVGYEGIYQVSNLGRIKRIERVASCPFCKCVGTVPELFLKHEINDAGYVIVRLSRRGEKQWNARLHRVVAIAFIPNLEDKECVNHKDFNKLNNSVENLEWMTNLENITHRSNAYRSGERTRKKRGIAS